MKVKEKEIKVEKEKEKEKECGESVYVFGSFTYGAKLWPACLAVSLGQ